MTQEARWWWFILLILAFRSQRQALWSTGWIPGQSGLQRAILSQEKKKDSGYLLLLEDPSWFPSTYTAAKITCNSSFKGSKTLWPPWASGIHVVVHRHKCKRNIYTQGEKKMCVCIIWGFLKSTKKEKKTSGTVGISKINLPCQQHSAQQTLSRLKFTTGS